MRGRHDLLEPDDGSLKKTSHVKKKILDSWSKLSTIIFSKKKDGDVILSHIAVLTESP